MWRKLISLSKYLAYFISKEGRNQLFSRRKLCQFFLGIYIVLAILKAKILDRYSWETNPLKRVLKFPLGVCISVGFDIPVVFYIFLAKRKLHAYILLCTYILWLNRTKRTLFCFYMKRFPTKELRTLTAENICVLCYDQILEKKDIKSS